jgi:hypothetical protein
VQCVYSASGLGYACWCGSVPVDSEYGDVRAHIRAHHGRFNPDERDREWARTRKAREKERADRLQQMKSQEKKVQQQAALDAEAQNDALASAAESSLGGVAPSRPSHKRTRAVSL